MLAAVLAKGSALASRQRSRYSRRGAMPLAVKKRRERHQGAWPRTDNAAHRPERGERSLENAIMVWTYSRADKPRPTSTLLECRSEVRVPQTIWFHNRKGLAAARPTEWVPPELVV